MEATTGTALYRKEINSICHEPLAHEACFFEDTASGAVSGYGNKRWGLPVWYQCTRLKIHPEAYL